MEIVYSRDIGFIFDISGIVFCLSNEKEAWEELFVIQNKKQEDLDHLTRILSYFKNISFSKKLMGVKIAGRQRILFSLLFESYNKSCQRENISIEGFGTYMADPERLKQAVVDWYLAEGLKSDEDALEQINLSNYSAELKAELYDVVLFPKRYAAACQNEYNELRVAMEKVYEEFYDEEKGKALLQQLLIPRDTELERELGERFRQHTSYYVGICVVQRYTIFSRLDCQHEGILILGIDIEEELDYRTGKSLELDNFANVLSDKTRVKILKLIQKNGTMTLVELAKALNLANTVVMYHLDILRKGCFLYHDVLGRRVLYYLNKDYIKKGIGELQKLLK